MSPIELLGLLGATMTTLSLIFFVLLLAVASTRERRVRKWDTERRSTALAIQAHRTIADRMREDREVAALDQMWDLPAMDRSRWA